MQDKREKEMSDKEKVNQATCSFSLKNFTPESILPDLSLTYFQRWTSTSQKKKLLEFRKYCIFGIFQVSSCAVFLHYDYFGAIEIEPAKIILYSLKITYTPKWSLRRVMSYFCRLYLVNTIVVYTPFKLQLFCR